jgi:hypothetical protein
MFIVKDEGGGSRIPQSIRKEANIAETIKLFLNPFDYLINAEYITPQQKAELRQMAVDAGIIAPSTPLEPTTTTPPKATYT